MSGTHGKGERDQSIEIIVYTEREHAQWSQ